jgi:hypothetical protein
MRVLRGLVLILFAVVLMPASAGATSISQDIHIKSVVLAAHTVEVDEQGNILRIASNTDEQDPSVKVITDINGERKPMPLTDEIAAEYQRLLPDDRKPGILYERTAVVLTPSDLISALVIIPTNQSPLALLLAEESSVITRL